MMNIQSVISSISLNGRNRRLALLLICLLLTFWTSPLAAQNDLDAPVAATVLRNANLRAGPGTNFAIVGSARAGDVVQIVGQNAAGNWYRLDTGAWIAAFLVRLEAEEPARPVAGVPVGAVAAQVVYVVDGDTIRVRLNGVEHSVRYILINAPESDQPFGPEATAANRRLVEGKTVYLLKDVSETDRYGRLLRYVFLADGTHVNAELVRQGYAQLATFPPDVSRLAEIRAAEQEARAAGRGLWGAGSSDPPPTPTPSRSGGNPWPAYTCENDPSPPPNPACPIKGNISRNGKIYHMPGQRDYCRTVIDVRRGERWFCSPQEAEAAGWRAARR